jgi:hypothetical protein
VRSELKRIAEADIVDAVFLDLANEENAAVGVEGDHVADHADVAEHLGRFEERVYEG